MANKSNDLVNDVINFISEETCTKVSKLSLDSSLFYNLGVDGEDALELIEKFSKKFNVNISDFPLMDYFGDEGSISPVKLLLYFVTRSIEKTKKNLTVGDLVKAAKEGILTGGSQ